LHAQPLEIIRLHDFTNLFGALDFVNLDVQFLDLTVRLNEDRLLRIEGVR